MKLSAIILLAFAMLCIGKLSVEKMDKPNGHPNLL